MQQKPIKQSRITARVLERETTISLTRKDAAMLFAMLQKPSSPNEVLVKAFERYKNEVKSGALNPARIGGDFAPVPLSDNPRTVCLPIEDSQPIPKNNS